MAPLNGRAAARVLIAASLVAGPALGLEGRYIGSGYRTEYDAGALPGEDIMRHQLDVGGHRTLPSDLDLRLRLSLQYQSRPGTPDSDLLRGRFFGDLRGSMWRLNGQYVPWQRTMPGKIPARERDLLLGLNLTPRDLPSLRLDYRRLDRETFTGRSSSDERRVGLAYSRSGIGSQASYRRVESNAEGIGAAPSLTQEWNAGVNATRSWRRASVQGAYDALLTSYEIRARRRDLRTQRLSASTTWNPVRQVVLGTSMVGRWGRATDNGLAQRVDLSEQFLDTNLEYKPWTPLTLQATHGFRRRRTAAGFLTSDYLQMEGTFRQPVLRDLVFQTGYLRSFNLNDRPGEIPNNTAYGLVDGSLRRGLEARAELRASAAASGPSTGTQWQRALQLRTRPLGIMRFDVGWRRDTSPEFEGVAQKDRTWELTGGYEPVPGASIVASWRRLDGHGRMLRTERATNLNTSWRVSERGSFGVNWSRRNSTVIGRPSRESVVGADLTFYLPRDLRAHGSWRELSGTGRPRARTYGLSLEKSF